ncbi:thioredoxin fold domain-containing protein [Piscirickettsia litoralis]|uniref:Thioredoxin n=1 Tax=Piscirickettsia litoralis TaxID=1891921 RepID=A0ABX3A082_9GAMM|nr:thioredoxin fold domain-containing protein [Piscirickettsia litoralis]ODN41880.1 thioredoxin [Piscirickettsia litoralis]
MQLKKWLALLGIGSLCLTGSLTVNSYAATTAVAGGTVSTQESPADRLLKQVSETKWFSEGKTNAPHQLYLIAEPNCSICHILYDKLKPYVKSGQLSIRWVMVAFIRDNSAGKVAAIWSAQDSVKALAKDEAGFNMAKESGGIEPIAANKIPLNLTMALKGNMIFFQNSGFAGTPSLIYRDKQGKSHISGFPRGDIKAFVDKLGKLPST